MWLLCLSKWFLRVAALTTVFLTAPAAADIDIRYAWGVRYFGDSTADVIPAPWYHPVNTKIEDLLVLQQQEDTGLPVTAYFRNNTAPGVGTTRPLALEDLLTEINNGNTASHIDYVLTDYESGAGLTQEDADIALVNTVNVVRSHSNPLINQAWVGDWGEFPGEDIGGNPWSIGAKRTTRAQFYFDSGVNIAQPDLYVYSYYHMHHDNTPAGGLGEFLSPTVRSGMFYGPLDKYSVAMKALPSDHQMIPWLNAYMVNRESEHNEDEGPPLEKEDLVALLQHTRLRGATGYATYTVAYWMDRSRKDEPFPGWVENYTNEQYRQDMVSAWDTLDPLFDTPGETIILNLDTVKTTGIEWSGVRHGDQVGILVTNLGINGPIQLDLPNIPGLPNLTDPVAEGTHQYFQYTITADQVVVVAAPLNITFVLAALFGVLGIMPHIRRKSGGQRD